MSNPEAAPAELVCGGEEPGAAVEVIAAREVPLGGQRAMTVRRTLPSRSRSLIGAWCFADHYGPDDVGESGGMSVYPHPHTGLATVSWLFSGEIEHRDSLGTHTLVRPGEVNLMTAGRGISHQEISTPRTRRLHGVQLWVALPADRRDCAPSFEHFAPRVVRRDGLTARVFLGDLLGEASPVRTATPLLGAELTLVPEARVKIDVEPTFEHGVLVDTGVVDVCTARGGVSQEVKRSELAYVAPGVETLELAAGSEVARILLLGGPPLGEKILMWWNFVGRTHEEVVAFREEWQQQVGTDRQMDGRFGVVSELAPIPAPPMPTSRLKPRGR